MGSGGVATESPKRFLYDDLDPYIYNYVYIYIKLYIYKVPIESHDLTLSTKKDADGYWILCPIFQMDISDMAGAQTQLGDYGEVEGPLPSI
jgi:hypothetical protein